MHTDWNYRSAIFRSRLVALAIALVTLLAFALRWWGIAAGLPYLYHPDEPRYITIVQRIVNTGDLNPHFFNYPSLFLYLHAALYLVWVKVAQLNGSFPSNLATPHELTMGTVYTAMPAPVLLGRGLSIVLGTASVPVLYLLGRDVTGQRAVGLLAALLLAIAPSHITHSRYITPDVVLVFCVGLALWSYVQVWKSGTTWQYVVAGVATGLVAGAKYNGALVVSALLVAHGLRAGWRGLRDGRIYGALALSGITFLLTTPFALLDWLTFWTHLRAEAHHYATGHAGMEGNTLSWYAAYLWFVAGPICVLALVELARGVWRRDGATLVLGSFAVLYGGFISTFVVRNDRTALPLLPCMFVLAAAHVVWLADRISRGAPRTRAWGLRTVLVGSIL